MSEPQEAYPNDNRLERMDAEHAKAIVTPDKDPAPFDFPEPGAGDAEDLQVNAEIKGEAIRRLKALKDRMGFIAVLHEAELIDFFSFNRLYKICLDLAVNDDVIDQP